MGKTLPELTAFDLRLLQVFDAVVQLGSFTAAQVKLNKSKSAISTDIAALETRLGVKLCQRGRGGFGLTDQGREIHDASLQLFRGMTGFRDAVSRISSRVAGDFTIAIDHDVASATKDRFSNAISEFTSKNTEIFISIQTSAPDQVTQLVMEGTADIGITSLDRAMPELAMHQLACEKMFLYCGAKHPLFKKPDSEIGSEMLERYDCIEMVIPHGSDNADFMSRLKIGARAATMQSRLMLIMTGQYIGFLPRDFARASVVSGDVRPINANAYFCPTNRYAVTRRNAPVNMARDQFLENLLQAMSPRPKIGRATKLSATVPAPFLPYSKVAETNFPA
jgi:DNA-binding transcriptional LysR family regulator